MSAPLEHGVAGGGRRAARTGQTGRVASVDLNLLLAQRSGGHNEIGRGRLLLLLLLHLDGELRICIQLATRMMEVVVVVLIVLIVVMVVVVVAAAAAAAAFSTATKLLWLARGGQLLLRGKERVLVRRRMGAGQAGRIAHQLLVAQVVALASNLLLWRHACGRRSLGGQHQVMLARVDVVVVVVVAAAQSVQP